MQGPYYNQYNTPLSGNDREGLYDTLMRMSLERGRNVYNDMNDYDMAGAYNAGMLTPDGRGHLDDTFKKPNHPTFSNESIYSGNYNPVEFLKAVLNKAPVRQPFASENEFFRNNKNVGGYAAEDGKVVVNPYTALNGKERNAIKANETIRQALRSMPEDKRPSFDLTKEQQNSLGVYSDNLRDVQDTILARILTGDPSAGKISPYERVAANQTIPLVLNYLGVKDMQPTSPTGGVWSEDNTFTPSAWNLQNMAPDQLQAYFNRVEPDAKLILPILAGLSK